MNKFRKDPNYLLHYCLLNLGLFVMLDSALFFVRGSSFSFQFQTSDLTFILLAVLLCGLPSSLMHNCAHGNIKPRWLNQAVGEICGTIMLYGYRGFALAHMYHHIFPDDPQMDPHPPQGQKFSRFVVSPIEATLRVVTKAYYDQFGENEKTRANIRHQLILFNLGLLARTAFWFLLLGPKFFLLGYLPVYAANIFVFAHINFAAHREREDGSSVVINLNHNLYYRYINIVSFGGYFHKSHHYRPQAFNPMFVKLDDSIPYVTYVPEKTFPVQATEEKTSA